MPQVTADFQKSSNGPLMKEYQQIQVSVIFMFQYK